MTRVSPFVSPEQPPDSGRPILIKPDQDGVIVRTAAIEWISDPARALARLDEIPLASQQNGSDVSFVMAYSIADVIEPTSGVRAVQGEPVLGIITMGESVDEVTSSDFRVGSLRSESGRSWYESRVRRAIELINAGDIFQANIAHQLVAEFEGDCASLCASVLQSGNNSATHAFALADPEHDLAICSLSPELLVHYNAATRGLVTKPIKGTRPVDRACELLLAEKDTAELNMITDLMRNDLGRVADAGTVRVTRHRVIEEVGHVAHAHARVECTARRDLTLGDLIRAVFPAGSITGAPKVRAMQIIEELEETPRGFAFGSMGTLFANGDLELSVGIRTATIRGGALRLPVGAGIVTDSNPTSEWFETLDKARTYAAALGSTLVDLEDQMP
ncbi:MAG: chorismate-binding protein [Planctomycetota bacterium]